MNAAWTWTDGWILMSLWLASGEQNAGAGVNLVQLIAAADATNVAIPTAQELSESLSKLVGCGLVTMAGERYAIAREWRAQVAAADAGPGGRYQAADKGLRFLAAAQLISTETHSLHFSDEDVQAAYEQYISRRRKPS